VIRTSTAWANDMKDFLRTVASQAAPRTFASVQAIRARRRAGRLMREWGCDRVAQDFRNRHGNTVLRGPFAGMKLGSPTWGGVVPKLLGCYELEITPAVEEAIGSEYIQVVNIGAADGYYAVGFALRMPKTKIRAFDTDWVSRRATRQAAEINRVRIEVSGFCSPQWLAVNLSERTFILCDCEGYERTLLDPAAAPSLVSADILVEVHESETPGVRQLLMNRFSKTHLLTEFRVLARDPSAYPELDDLPEGARAIAVSEFRPPLQTWMLMRSKAG
jgi:hypothetical protein